ncbi:MAG: type II secretion system protein N [Acidovorax sp.]|jgi:general secretion pathway protein C
MATTSLSNPWGVRLATLVLWAAAAASAVYWGLRLSASGPVALAPPPVASAVAPDAQALARLLGAVPSAASAAPAAPEVALASRFALIGVISGRSSGGGAALIAVDGQPAKPYRVGAAVAPGLVLQALGPRQAQLGPAMGEAATLTLEMPFRK